MPKIRGELREYDPSKNESKPSTAFIDLAARRKIEDVLYPYKNSVTYFVRETVRSSWFTLIPIQLQSDAVNPTFGQSFNVTASREGDYLLNAWLRISLNAISVYFPAAGDWVDPKGLGRETIGWTPNFMHNLVEKCTLKVNGMVIDELYSEHLDFISAFMVPKSHRIGYNRMIGNFNTPWAGLGAVNVSGYQAGNYPNVNWQQELFLPLPFFFSKDSGVSLPMSSLPYNDIKIECKFRHWRNLLSSIDADGNIVEVNASQLTGQSSPYIEPAISNVQLWANYAIVTDRERKKVGCRTRDMLIEQNQQLGGSYGSKMLDVNTLGATTSIDLRFHGAVKALFFAARNSSGSTTLPYRSNYSTSSPSASDITVVRLNCSGVNTGTSNLIYTGWNVSNVGGYSSGEATIRLNGNGSATLNIPFNDDALTESALPLFKSDGTPVGDCTGSDFILGNIILQPSGANASGYDVTPYDIDFAATTQTGFDNGDGLYMINDFVEENSSSTATIPPLDIHINSWNENSNDRSGFVWYKDPTDPFGSIKIVYENSIRFDMESLYFSLIQPHAHARNVPDSSSVKGIMSLRNPSEVSGQSALTVGYHMYSYALRLKDVDPSGSTNYDNLHNAVIVFTPSTSAINNYASGQGPWKIFVSALSQNIMRISAGAISFPIL